VARTAEEPERRVLAGERMGGESHGLGRTILMEPMAGKLRCDNSTMNCAIWVTNESCNSAGRSFLADCVQTGTRDRVTVNQTNWKSRKR